MCNLSDYSFKLPDWNSVIEEDIQEKYRGFVFYGDFGDNTLILIVNLSEPKEIDEKLLNQIKSNAKKYLNIKSILRKTMQTKFFFLTLLKFAESRPTIFVKYSKKKLVKVLWTS